MLHANNACMNQSLHWGRVRVVLKKNTRHWSDHNAFFEWRGLISCTKMVSGTAVTDLKPRCQD